MRILFLSHYFPPEVNAPASRTFEHCVRWAQAGHQVTVITGQPNCPTGVVYEGYKNRLLPQREHVGAVEVVRVWTYVAPNVGVIRRTLNYLSYMASAVLAGWFQLRPDVIVATSPQFFCGWAGILLGWLRWRPVVLEIRDVWPASIEAVGAMRSRPALRMLERLEKWMYLAASHIVTVGKGYRTHVLERTNGRHADRISVITNGVDLTRFRPREPSSEFLDRYALRDKFVCSYVGTIGMAHGLDVVLRAAQLLQQRGRDDIVFCLVGEGARKSQLQAMAQQLGVEHWIRFTGMLPNSEMPTVIASANALLVHLRACELFQTVIPSKIFETMAMERPLIIGVTGEAYEIINQAHAGIAMRPESESDLVSIVERLADHPELARDLSESGRHYVYTHYNRDRLAAEFLEILARVAERPLTPSSDPSPVPTEAPDASEVS